MEGVCSAEELSQPVFGAIPTAKSFFQDERELVEEFEVDYELVRGFKLKVGDQCAMVLAPCLPCLTCYWYGFERQNLSDKINATHVCITQNGIRFAVDRRDTCCRCQCSQAGRTSKTVPFDKITDCDIHEPAGASGPFCSVPNVITRIIIDTASSGVSSDGIVRHELIIEGLKDPRGFKDMVWQMKQNFSSAKGSAPTAVQDMKRTVDHQSETINLLREQNRLHEEQLAVLKELLAKQ